MINPVQLIRLLRINLILLKYGLVRSVVGKHRRLRLASYFNPWSFRKNSLSRGESIRIGLEKLGPIFIKFGQVLSTRRDLLADDIADELAKLQDQVPAFSGEQAKALVECELGKPIEAIFSRFEIQPLASASIAQVHAAELHDGSDVIVKVLRPQIDKIIRHDIALMYLVARLVRKFWRSGQRLKPVELVKEFEQTLLNEMDLSREAANACQLKRNFQHSDLMYVPAVHWPLITPRVMVMERIYGVRISDLANLHQAKVNLKKLAEHGVEIFFTQVLRDSFFHADMHPGNLFVDIKDPQNPKYLGVDFGIMGTLSPEDQHYLAANLLAFFKRDYRRVAVLHVECGWVPADTRVDQFESAMRTVCEPIFERPLKDISFGKLLLTLFRIAEQFNMSIQPQLMLLQKTLLNIEGLGRQLYPDLDLWHTAKPFLEQWMKKQHGLLNLLKQGVTELPQIAEKLLRTPELFYQFLQHKQNQPDVNTALEKPQKNGSFFTGTGLAFAATAIISYFAEAPAFWIWGAGILAVASFLIKTQVRNFK